MLRRWIIPIIAFLLPIAAAAVLRGLGPEPASLTRHNSPWNGGYFTNAPVVDQDGNVLKFYDDVIRDKIVVFNFIFTGCSQLCPLTTARLAEVQQKIGPAAGRDVFFVSISLDPANDTPAALKKFANNFHVGPGWKFLTGKPEDLKFVRERLGERSRVMQDHQAQIVIGNDKTGEWGKDSAMSEVDDLVRTVMSYDPQWRAKERPVQVNADAAQPHTLNDAPGQTLFVKMCSNCHTIGKGDRVGPDLKGVTGRRNSQWLKGFIVDAEKMRKAGDATAIELFEKYKGIQMPNLGLVEVDAADVISYIERESHRNSEASAAPSGDGPATAR